MRKLKKIFIVTFLVSIVLLCICINKSVENTKKIYYNDAFSYVTDIYIDTSGILNIEKQEDLDTLRDTVIHYEKELALLETNIATLEGEKIVEKYLEYVHQAINLKQEMFDKNEMWRNDGIFELVDQYTIQYREFVKSIE